MRRLVLMLLATLCLAAPAEAATRFGFADDQSAWEEAATQAKQIGANTARIPIGWNLKPSEFAATNQMLRPLGIRPIITLWGCENPSSMHAWKHAVKAWTRAYPNAVIQLWNEPNHPYFGDFKAHFAGRLARAGAIAARTVRPHGPILGPALAPETRAGEPSRHYRHYLRTVYNQIPDRLHIKPAINVYPYGPRPMRTIADYFHLGSRYGEPWVTEVGIGRRNYGSRQPELTARAYETLLGLDAPAILIYRLLPAGSYEKGCVAGPLHINQYGDPIAGLWETAMNMAVLGNPALEQAIESAVQSGT